MYGGLADAEFIGCGAHRGPVLYDVKSEALCPLLHVFFQNTLTPPRLVGPSYAGKEGSIPDEKAWIFDCN